MKIIIYATHSFGTYETLIKHPDVICLGFGTKWEGFIKKAETICDYLNHLPEDEIVAVIDGFDSYIRKTDGIENEFLKQNCKVLVSINGGWLSFKYLEKRIFSSCKNDKTANAGLIMGYVKELKQTYTYMKNGESDDDQRNLNIACKQMPYIKVDANCTIFENCNNLEDVKKSKAYICQIPGDISFQRIIRSIFEYSNIFIPEIVTVTAIILILLNYKKIKKYIKKIK
jgi:hypothetical protein